MKDKSFIKERKLKIKTAFKKIIIELVIIALPFVLIAGLYTVSLKSKDKLIPRNAENGTNLEINIKTDENERLKLKYLVPFKYYVIIDIILDLFE